MRSLIAFVVFQIAYSTRVSTQLGLFLDENSTDESDEEVHLAGTNMSAIFALGRNVLNLDMSSSRKSSDEMRFNETNETHHRNRSKDMDSEEDGRDVELGAISVSNATNASHWNWLARAGSLSFDKTQWERLFRETKAMFSRPDGSKENYHQLVTLSLIGLGTVLCLLTCCCACLTQKKTRKKGFMASMTKRRQAPLTSEDDSTSSNGGDGKKRTGLLAKGKESRGVDSDAKYKFGDLSRGVIRSAKQGEYKFGDFSREVIHSAKKGIHRHPR